MNCNCWENRHCKIFFMVFLVLLALATVIPLVVVVLTKPPVETHSPTLYPTYAPTTLVPTRRPIHWPLHPMCTMSPTRMPTPHKVRAMRPRTPYPSLHPSPIPTRDPHWDSENYTLDRIPPQTNMTATKKTLHKKVTIHAIVDTSPSAGVTDEEMRSWVCPDYDNGVQLLEPKLFTDNNALKTIVEGCQQIVATCHSREQCYLVVVGDGHIITHNVDADTALTRRLETCVKSFKRHHAIVFVSTRSPSSTMCKETLLGHLLKPYYEEHVFGCGTDSQKTLYTDNIEDVSALVGYGLMSLNGTIYSRYHYGRHNPLLRQP